jgi:hypothetical protein
MTEEKKHEAFLDRWSRLKSEQPAKPAESPAPASAQQGLSQPLPPVENLTPESNFAPFMNAEVDPEMRRSALKKLFSDAHFSLPDPYEPYSVDLTVAESIPEEMLKKLNHAKRLLFDEPEKVVEAQAQAEAQAPAQPQTQTQETDLKNVAGKQDS